MNSDGTTLDYFLTFLDDQHTTSYKYNRQKKLIFFAIKHTLTQYMELNYSQNSPLDVENNQIFIARDLSYLCHLCTANKYNVYA